MILCLIRHSEFSESYYEVTDVSEAISVTVYWEFFKRGHRNAAFLEMFYQPSEITHFSLKLPMI